MKKLFLGALSAIAMTVAAQADPAMWKVSDEDSEILLFGSVHVLREDTQWRTDALDAAIAAADEVYYETPMTVEAQAASQQLIPQFGLNPQGQTLSSMLTEEQNAQLARVAGQMGLPVQNLEPLRPWLAGLTISLIGMQQAGYNPMTGVEMTLSAVTEDERERYFETFEDQFGFFAGLSPEVELHFLTFSLEQIENDPGMLDRMVAAWAAGDVAALDTIFHEGMQEAGPEVYDVLLVQRNHHWVDEIETMLEGSGKTLIVVGAGHLVGPDGVPTLLEAEGITVERVQ
ncbi:TraB/GumN family protein [Maricaulis sp.]|uniref:TraB/GumN family protein n=1 Tax=Maricaulis sp. TaxID=1486257 RepID=UPI00261D0F0E|nr:TraB/GumN family protein [Maricaulis sp.]